MQVPEKLKIKHEQTIHKDEAPSEEVPEGAPKAHRW
jgi:hypothetical protein